MGCHFKYKIQTKRNWHSNPVLTGNAQASVSPSVKRDGALQQGQDKGEVSRSALCRSDPPLLKL